MVTTATPATYMQLKYIFLKSQISPHVKYVDSKSVCSLLLLFSQDKQFQKRPQKHYFSERKLLLACFLARGLPGWGRREEKKKSVTIG